MKKNPASENLIISMIVKIMLLIAFVYGCLNIEEGLRTFTKFTTLSNVGIAAAVLPFLYADLIEYRTGKNIRTQKLYVLKYLMTASIMLTFFVYLLILAPTHEKGFWGAYANHHFGSFAFHMAVPMLALIDFFLFDQGYVPKFGHCLYGTIPPLAYLGFILILASTGYRWDYGMSAPYNFMNFAAPCGWWGILPHQADHTTLGIGAGYMILLLILLFVLMGFLLIMIKKRIQAGKNGIGR